MLAVDLFGNEYQLSNKLIKSINQPASPSLPEQSGRELTIIPTIAIHPDRINLYNEVNWSPSAPPRRTFEHLLSSDRTSHGNVSCQAKRKIEKALKYLIFIANPKHLPDTAHGKALNFKVSFITLTLPSQQRHTDKVIISSCLNQFLIEAKKKWKVTNYVWRAEKQSNGNIHFHILCDRFISWCELRNVWNRIVEKLGYVSGYRDEMKLFHNGGFHVRKDLLKQWEYKSQVKAYQTGKANDWSSPNSTDVHSIRNIRNILSYLSKYLTKTEQCFSSENIPGKKCFPSTGRIWGCSYTLSDLKGAQLHVDSSINDELQVLFDSVHPRFYKGDYFSVYYFNVIDLYKHGGQSIFLAFAQYLNHKFGYSLSPPIL